MSTTAIFWPVLVQMALTFLIYFKIFPTRVGLIKSGQAKSSDFRTYENEHPESRKVSRAIANQYESPVIFYALCVIAFVTQNADTVLLVLAWGYSIVKVVHVYLHITKNRLRYRQPVFTVAFFLLILMFCWTAFKLATT